MNLVNKHKLNSIKPTPLSFGEGPGVRLFGARYVACADERGNSVPIAIGIRVWLSVDPMADVSPNKSPYHYCSNNPVMKIDPLGLTDYTYYKKTGETKQVGEKNDRPNRILKTKRNGEIKTDKNGNSKVAIDNIKNGILKDRQNFKTDDQIFEVGGEGQPSVNGVEEFAYELSEYVGKEIGGAYYSKDGSEDITHMTIGQYQYNTSTKVDGQYVLYKSTLSDLQPQDTKGFFHTHPAQNGYSYLDRSNHSPADKTMRNEALGLSPMLRFFILTRPYDSGNGYEKIEYTK